MTVQRAVALMLALSVAGCGTKSEEFAGQNLMVESAKTAASSLMFWKKKPAAKPVNGEAMARSALKLNKGPLILASFENTGYTDIFGMVGENGTMRTYNSPEQRAIILRNGVIAGTRGFGFDVMSAETSDVTQLIRARQAGRAKKTVRYLDGLGFERPIPFDCEITTGPSATYPFAGQEWAGQQVVERCSGSGVSIANSYVVSSAGQILASRQWVMPEIGYVTVQTVRP